MTFFLRNEPLDPTGGAGCVGCGRSDAAPFVDMERNTFLCSVCCLKLCAALEVSPRTQVMQIADELARKTAEVITLSETLSDWNTRERKVLENANERLEQRAQEAEGNLFAVRARIAELEARPAFELLAAAAGVAAKKPAPKKVTRVRNGATA